MPYITQWVPADIAASHNGVTVLHTYKYDDYNGMRFEYCYCLGDEEGVYEDDSKEFDIRDLPNYNPGMQHKTILEDAIEKGYIKNTNI